MSKVSLAVLSLMLPLAALAEPGNEFSTAIPEGLRLAAPQRRAEAALPRLMARSAAMPPAPAAGARPYALYHDFSLPFHQGRSMVWVVSDGKSGPTAWVTVILEVNHGPEGSLIVYSKDHRRLALPNRGYPILDWVNEAAGVRKGSAAVCSNHGGPEVGGKVEGVFVNPMRVVYWLSIGEEFGFFERCRPAA